MGDGAMPKRYSEELKMEITRRHKQGEPVKLLSQELGLAQSTIYAWLKKIHCIKTSVWRFTPADFDKLVRHVKKLEHEFEVIRQTRLIAAVPLQKRLTLLAEMYQEGKYSVYELCEALEVARGTFYNHIFRRADRSAREWEQAELARKPSSQRLRKKRHIVGTIPQSMRFEKAPINTSSFIMRFGLIIHWNTGHHKGLKTHILRKCSELYIRADGSIFDTTRKSWPQNIKKWRA